MLNQPVKNAGLRFAAHLALPVILISKPQIQVELSPETAFPLLTAIGVAVFGAGFVQRLRRS
ncbi:hypothetical protein ACGF07_33000 [Kitasatospora sp. NPDC048194]|uniref:hypothetical protein n=1 Tax=Kitasatospora sp. NPDC048194 TaxID=3364045 RepID=UPI003711B04A